MPYELEIKAEPMKFLRSLPVKKRKQDGDHLNAMPVPDFQSMMLPVHYED